MTGPPGRNSPGALAGATGANHFSNHLHPEFNTIPADVQINPGPEHIGAIADRVLADLLQRFEARP